MAAFFADDNMYHERVLLWFVEGMKWVVLTPDLDVYIEDFSGHGDPGCDFFKIKNVDFQYWSRLGSPVYRFSHDISDAELKGKITESIGSLGDAVHMDGAWRPTKILLKDGSTEDATAFLETALVGRRLRGKGPKNRSAGDPGERDRHVSRNVTPAGEGMVWVAAEPLGNLILGQEVSLNIATDVQVGDRTALINRGGELVKAELIRVEDCQDYALRRRALFKDPTAPAAEMPSGTKLLDQIDHPSKNSGEDEKSEEVRTLWVDYDEHGERFKRWREVCKESYTPVFDEKPIDGPLTALHFIKHAERHGGDLRQWLMLWCRAKHVEPTDRGLSRIESPLRRSSLCRDTRSGEHPRSDLHGGSLSQGAIGGRSLHEP